MLNKKYLKVFLSILMVSVLSLLAQSFLIPINAVENGNSIFCAEDEIKVDEQLILDSVNSFVQDMKGIKIDSIDYSKIIRIYSKTEIEKMDSIDIDTLKSLLNTYAYQMPVFADDETILISLEKGKEIPEDLLDSFTQDEIDLIESRKGKWHASVATPQDVQLDYSKLIREFIKENNLDIENCFVIGGLCKTLGLVLAYPTSSGDIKFFSLNPYTSIPTDSIDFEGNWIKEDSIYTFEEVKELVLEYKYPTLPFEGEDFDGQGTSSGKWIKSGSRWWYKHTDGTYTKNNWELINGKWYHFDKKGWMQTGWLKLNGKWYYLSSSGAMQTGWVKDNGKWYYLSSSGAMLTGWRKISNKWYYFKDDGVMKTGWLKISGKWYYLTSGGAMKTGWGKIKDKWYYFDKSGKMQTGLLWLPDKSADYNDQAYFFNENGAMQKNCWKKVNQGSRGDCWYYFGSEGKALLNQYVNGYFVNSIGEWVKDYKKIEINREIESVELLLASIDASQPEAIEQEMKTGSDADAILSLSEYLNSIDFSKINSLEKNPISGNYYKITLNYADGTSEEYSVSANTGRLSDGNALYDIDINWFNSFYESL